jgi:hypothetical protein
MIDSTDFELITNIGQHKTWPPEVNDKVRWYGSGFVEG